MWLCQTQVASRILATSNRKRWTAPTPLDRINSANNVRHVSQCLKKRVIYCKRSEPSCIPQTASQDESFEMEKNYPPDLTAPGGSWSRQSPVQNCRLGIRRTTNWAAHWENGGLWQQGPSERAVEEKGLFIIKPCQESRALASRSFSHSNFGGDGSASPCWILTVEAQVLCYGFVSGRFLPPRSLCTKI